MKAHKSQQNARQKSERNTQQLPEAEDYKEQEEQEQQQPIDLIDDQYQQETNNHLQHTQENDKYKGNQKQYAKSKNNSRNMPQDKEAENQDEDDTAHRYANIRANNSSAQSYQDANDDQIGQMSLWYSQQQNKKGKKSAYQSVGDHHLAQSQSSKSGKAKRLGLGLMIIVVIVILVGVGTFSKGLPSKTSQTQLTCIFLITNSYNKAMVSISTFLDSNSCSKVIIASHFDYSKSKNTPNLVQTLKNDNIEWVIQKRPDYDLFFIDQLIKKVQTQYYFYANTFFNYQDDSFVKYSLEILEKFPQVGQLMGIVGNQTQNAELGARKIGFSWMPGVHRKKDYELAADGYASVAKQATKNLEQAQYILSQFYRSKGLYVMAAPGDFNIEDINNPRPKTNKKNKNPRKSNNYKNTANKQQESPRKPKFDISSLVTDKQSYKQTPLNPFSNNFQNSQYFLGLSQYLTHNKAESILHFAPSNPFIKLSTQIFTVKHIRRIQQLELSSPPHDWLVHEGFDTFVNVFIGRNFDIGKYTKYGVSLVWALEENTNQFKDKISAYFSEKGFYYDQAKSLCLRRVENKVVMIYIKGSKINPKYKTQFAREPINNYLAIQTVFKLRQNLPYLREWLIYHINMGFDKFYLYDNTNSLGSNLDPKSQKYQNKFGMSFECMGIAEEQSIGQLRYIWAQFYEHIIYVLWQPKDQFQRIIYGQVESQHDYLQFYKQICKYTLFIDIDEYIFSPMQQNLQTYLSHYSQNRISSIKLKQRHFVSRFCSPNKRVIEIQHYFPEDDDRLWGVKVMTQTMYFSPFGDISQGRVTVGRQIVVPADQFRINHYNFQKDGLKLARTNRYSAFTRFERDTGMSRYKAQMDKLCNQKCSQVFAISCPYGQQWKNCLDVAKTYRLDSNEIEASAPSEPAQKTVQPTRPTQPNRQEPAPIRYPPIRNNNNNNIQARKNIGQYLVQLTRLMSDPTKIFEIHLLKQKNELPICILSLPSQKHSDQSLDTSIKSQDYKNYKIIKAPSPAPNKSQNNYFSYFEHLQKNCEENSFIMFLTAPLRQGALTYINKMLQEYRAWAVYAKSDVVVQVVGFYLRIYQMLNINDFGKANQEILKNENKVGQTLGMLQLCMQAAKDVQRDLIYTDTNFYSYFSVLKSDDSKLQRRSYTKVIRLSQDMDTNVAIGQRSRAGITAARVSPLMKLTSDNMYRAVDRQQQWFLPSSHSIQQLQLQQYSTLYNITSNFPKQKQVHFCVTILSHNNIQNNRYIKVMKSIVMQKYDNYHIVFIDDNSTDSNMNGTIEFMNKIKFPKQRITYVQNLRRNFATYNIINAAFNFCGQDDVQMLMDGDDEFVGKYAFHVMNAAYQQQQDIWVAYSNYKTNFYGYGRSRGMTSEYDHAAGNRRSYISFFGAIRTFRVKVIYNIPPVHHKMANGQWLDTVYDDALCHPLFQVSGFKRVAYVPELLYEYNMRYGDNDDSTSQKIRHRSEVYRYIISIPILPKLETLAGTVKNAQIQAELKADLNVRYKIIQV